MLHIILTATLNFQSQNLCVSAAHCPIREILEKEKKVSRLSSVLLFFQNLVELVTWIHNIQKMQLLLILFGSCLVMLHDVCVSFRDV